MEVWKEIGGTNGRYLISNFGEVFDTNTNSIVKKHIDGDYYAVNIQNRKEKMHRLVAKYFCVKPERAYFVNHIDGNRYNNHHTNLVWEVSLLYGVGVNRPRLKDKVGTKILNTWEGMLARCYYHKNPWYCNYGGKGITVSEEWKDFNIFNKWFMDQISKNKSYNSKWQLDKDILSFGTVKQYSEANCVLVPRELNQIFKFNNKIKRDTLNRNKLKWEQIIKTDSEGYSSEIQAIILSLIRGEYDNHLIL